MPSTARLLSSAFVIEPANVSTPRSTSQSGIDVAITRTSLAPSSVSWRTRWAPRKPVPPVTRVTARWRFSIAARRFVPVVVMRAVRFVGVLLGIVENEFRNGRKKDATQGGTSQEEGLAPADGRERGQAALPDLFYFRFVRPLPPRSPALFCARFSRASAIVLRRTRCGCGREGLRPRA